MRRSIVTSVVALAAFGGASGRTAHPATPAAFGGALAAAPFVVALDPGHGGSNLGAVAPATPGLLEKDVTLALARRVRARLATAPGVRVVLCREADVLVPIRSRARCAAEAHAQLFLSLHANATPAGVAPGTQRGYELYVLPPEDVDADATLAAMGAPGAAGVWAAHLVHAASEQSLVAARAIDRRLTAVLGRQSARGIRQTGAALDVLRGTGRPAVLVEVGFLDHPEEGARLVTPAGQERLAEALARAVMDLANAHAGVAAAPHPAAAR